MTLKLARLLADIAGARLWLLLALMVTGALAEAVGLVSLVPLIFISFGEQDEGLLASWLARSGVGLELESALAIFLGAFAIRIAIGLFRDHMMARLDARLEAEIGKRAARGLAAIPFGEVAKRGRGDIQSLLGFDIPRASAAAGAIVQMLGQAALLGVAGMAAFILSPPITLIAIAVALLILLAAAPRWRGSHAEGDRICLLHAEQDATTQHFFGALKASKAHGNSDALANAYGARLGATATAQARLDMRQANTRAIILAISALAVATMVLLGARTFGLGLATLATLLLLFARLIGPVQAMQRVADQLAGLLPAFARVQPLLEPQMHSPVADAAPFKRIEAANLALVHDGAPLFEQLSFALAPGEWLAITGASGSGKTGLVDIMAGLVRPNDGSLTVDGKPLADVASWPASIAYVPQADLIFHGSIEHNLSVGSRPGQQLMRDALHIVGLDRSLDQPVSEIGGALSGGERQRLLIARALCRRPHLLLLDESLSALDLASARTILGRVKSAYPTLGVVLVTHRMELAAGCDHRITLGSGKPNG